MSIKSNDKKRARINTMRTFLNEFDYEGKDRSVVYPQTRCSFSAAEIPSRTDMGSARPDGTVVRVVPARRPAGRPRRASRAPGRQRHPLPHHHASRPN
jgi:hypothetical protein